MKFSAPLLAGLALLACSSHPSTEAASTPTATPLTSQQPAPTFPETFEAGAKGAYAEGDEQLATGAWHFTEALIGSSEQDHKAGEHAARLRNRGRLRMGFDVPAGVRQVRISAAAYGQDGPSTWELWLSRDHGRTFTRMGAPIVTKGPTLVAHTFAGVANEPIRLEIRKTSGADARLNIDDIDLLRTNAPIPKTSAPVAGPSGGGSIKGGGGVGNPTQPAPTAADNDNLLLGNPSGATSDPANTTNYLLIHPQFATGYNAQRGIPTWTCWHVGRQDLTKAAPRQDDFRPDPALPRQFYQITPKSYAGAGFDKGHNCPSGDRTATLDDNSATFLMSNMIPQAPQNNQQTWAHLEEYTRSQVEKGQEAYVLMGCYGRGGTGKNGPATLLDQNRLTVPARIWKVVVFLPQGTNDLQRLAAGQGRILAIDTPNDNNAPTDWRQYLTSVDKIEAATGLDLLSALPAATQARLQKMVDSGK